MQNQWRGVEGRGQLSKNTFLVVKLSPKMQKLEN